jgi:predicted permease
MNLGIWRRRGRDAELDAEIRSHLEMAARDRMDRGEPAREAREAARREFGNEVLVKEVTHGAWGGAWAEILWQDIRYGARSLRRSPGFAIIAVLTLTLGIGANTALFSVVNGVLLNPLPFPQSDRLVHMYESKINFEKGSITYPNFLDWQRGSRSFTGMAAHRQDNFTLTGTGEAERVPGEMISAGFFSVLGVKPFAGRWFTPEEDQRGARPVALISEGFWERKLGSAPDAVGRTLNLDGTAHTIVGIVPSSFRLVMSNFRPADVYTPIGQWTYPLFWDRATANGMDAIARLRPGVTLEQARAEMREITRQLALEYPQANEGTGANIIPLKDAVVEGVHSILLLLLGAVGFVLLIACANVANLLLARSNTRTREFAIRAALGAGRGRIVRQLLTESMLLALGGGILGVLLASWGTQAALNLAVTLNPGGIPRADEVRLNGPVLLFTIAITLFVGFLFGLAPALKRSHPDMQDSLREGARGATARARGLRAFVAAEVGMALVLLVGAGLMIRSLVHLWDDKPGFDPNNVVTFYMSLDPAMQNATVPRIQAEFDRVVSTISSVPGVEAVSIMNGSLPMQGDSEDPFWIVGRPKPLTDNDKPWALWYEVDPNYLKAMGIALLRGRFFTPADNENSRGVAVVDGTFAEKYFPGENPVGKTIVDDYLGPTEIVGVIGHVKHWGPANDMNNRLQAEMYFPYAWVLSKFATRMASGFGVVVRANGDPLAIVGSIRAALARMNTQQVMYDVQTMKETVSKTFASQQFLMILLGMFAALALLLASVGIYGVVSYLAGQRTHEIGIRLALGAQRTHVLRLVLSEALKMTCIGVGIGLASAFVLTRLMAGVLYGATEGRSSLLYRVSATDPLTFGLVALVLAIVALGACYVPARRATRVDPIVALKYE